MGLLLAAKIVLGYLRLHCVCEGVRQVAGIGGALGGVSILAQGPGVEKGP